MQRRFVFDKTDKLEDTWPPPQKKPQRSLSEDFFLFLSFFHFQNSPLKK